MYQTMPEAIRTIGCQGGNEGFHLAVVNGYLSSEQCRPVGGYIQTDTQVEHGDLHVGLWRLYF